VRLIAKFVTVMFSLIGTQALADDIVLFIKERGTDAPLQRALVTQPDQTQFTSNAEGKVDIKDITPPIALTISLDGYLSVQSTIASSADPIVILLDKDATALDTIEVSAYRGAIARTRHRW